ncbi:MAG: hypothetical protein CMH62_00665 [Nanoarchaeota archaeon]|nr:hypothetical protein [Nanoarchaeota archaeon]|tara:strand:+ start:909 stop:1238 length:330 start_codon:yes stop_codon:yes gene_type:complete
MSENGLYDRIKEFAGEVEMPNLQLGEEFNKGKLIRALNRTVTAYHKALDYLEHHHGVTDEEVADALSRYREDELEKMIELNSSSAYQETDEEKTSFPNPLDETSGLTTR